ncbi:hypothetical protein BELL_0733g00010 [Botrytis elliptica]|uniref:Uncharacterized protein n=1 Tax=Botrytis elliptica TaxID=278938 RepID=A0A4Z1JLX9_9HELO|nr:hypothetical protein BELL_0733g00010 [Botrytis elliptica]
MALLSIIEERNRHKYGLKWQEVIVTNQTQNDILGEVLFRDLPRKKVSAVQGQRDKNYIEYFENNLRFSLKEFLLSSLSNCSWTLNVLHLGFGDKAYLNPIVIHILIQTPDYFTGNESAALKVLQGMDEIIHTKLNNQKLETHQQINIDICQIRSSMLRSSDDDTDSGGVDLMYSFKDLYRMYTPCPGLSIGREDFRSTIGSLAGFLKHEDDIYSLTCRHVVFPDTASQIERYIYRDEGEMSKLNISIPAPMDHDKTLRILRNNLKNVKTSITVLCKDQETYNKDYSKQINKRQEEENIFRDHIQEAENHQTSVGYVYAAPEKLHKISTYKGFLDWSIIRNTYPAPKNMLSPATNLCHNDQVRDFIEYMKETHEWPKNKCEEYDAKLEGLDNAERIFVKNPNSASSTLCNDTIYFKPASRTFGWKACSMNGIMSIHTIQHVHNTTPETSDEYAFVGRQEGAISTRGDSGALIYELEACADGKTVVLTPMAMIWAGNPKGGVVLQGFDDITYATPVDVLSRDIENEMGWDGGSLKFHQAQE